MEKELYKTSITSSLDGKPNVIFFHNADNLNSSELEKILEYAKESPHRYILSSKSLYKIPKPIRDKMHPIRIGAPQPDEFFEALNQLMLNPDREKVREILANIADVEALLHILKNNIWKVDNQQVWYAVENSMRLLYKVSPEFLVSLLAYLFPVCKVPLSFERKEKLYIREKQIIDIIGRRYKMNVKESLEQFEVVKLLSKTKVGNSLALELELDDEQRKFLGIVEQAKQSISSPQILVPQDKGLEKWL